MPWKPSNKAFLQLGDWAKIIQFSLPSAFLSATFYVKSKIQNAIPTKSPKRVVILRNRLFLLYFGKCAELKQHLLHRNYYQFISDSFAS